ncbi:MAG TPA: hypothetical protein VNZ67_05925 [bacterium]|jgi:hypothetical protein|nr:hypothetical protein [bacterium]
MKACAQCGETLADVAARCPSCGTAVGSQILDLGRAKDEPVGFEREAWVAKAIASAMGLLVLAALMWFLK